ncbi:MAG TPA: hypothetical protein VD816_12095, partial [Ohtaekwangia sp.]|nr:hypothetical protein [Ohtaekwangia sp.]
HIGIIPLRQPEPVAPSSISLKNLQALSDDDENFATELTRMYEKQTPDFVHKLREALKSHDITVLKSICHQVRSSYGIVDMPDLIKVLHEVSVVIERNDLAERGRLTTLVNLVISFIMAITDEVKRNMRKTG